MKRYPFYFFDLDGTLIDTADLIHECFKYLLSKEKLQVPPKKKITSLIGLPLKNQFQKYFPEKDEAGLEAVFNDYMGYQYLIYKDYLKLFPDVIETLALLKSEGHPLALVTSRRKKSAELFTQETGLFGFFDVIITPENTEKHKPEPDPAILAWTQLGKPKGTGLFVGDAEFDMACGKAAGLETAFVNWGPNDISSLKTKPDHILKSMKELIF